MLSRFRFRTSSYGPSGARIVPLDDDRQLGGALRRPALRGQPQGLHDLRSDAPLLDAWRPDSVAVAVGCWFGAEAALAAAGIRLRHVELGIQGPLLRTGVETVRVGRFGGPLVVSMRPFASADVPRVVEITSRLPRSHGAPVHVGDPAALGIANPEAPDWGEALPPEPGEQRVFWGCGLTALSALLGAGLDAFVSHAPGAMLVTDLPEGPAEGLASA